MSAAEWIAIAGSVLSAIVVVLLVAAFVSIISMFGADRDGGFNWPAMIPGFLGAAIYLAIAYGLARRSRAAWVVGMVVNAWTLLGTILIVATGNGLAVTSIPYALGVPAALVVGGLAFSWRCYWRRSQPI